MSNGQLGSVQPSDPPEHFDSEHHYFTTDPNQEIKIKKLFDVLAGFLMIQCFKKWASTRQSTELFP